MLHLGICVQECNRQNLEHSLSRKLSHHAVRIPLQQLERRHDMSFQSEIVE
jgi:hypothetical protein